MLNTTELSETELELNTDQAYIEELIVTHREIGIRMARSIAKRWGSHFNADDLQSAVDLALCQSAARYNPNRGVSFPTFLFYYVRCSVRQLIEDAVRYRRIDDTVRDECKKNAETGLGQGQEMPGTEPSASLKVNPEDSMLKLEAIKEVHLALHVLEPHERNIVQSYFLEGVTKAEIARRTGFSSRQVVHMAQQALVKLRASLKGTPVAKPELSVNGRAPRIRRRRRACLSLQARNWQPNQPNKLVA